MELFADDNRQIADAAGQWVGPLLAILGSAVAALFSFLSSRDKLRFDAKVVKLEAAQEQLEAEHKQCEEERGADRQRYDAELAWLRAAVAGKTPGEKP